MRDATRGILLGALLSLSVSASGATESACVTSVRFELEPQGSLPDGLQGKILLHPKADSKESRTLAAKLGAPVTAELPCGTQWEATPEFPNVWGPRRTVVAASAGAPVVSRLALWPLGKITGEVKLAEKGDPLPKVLAVTTLAPRSAARRDTPKGSLDCPVEPGGHWSCPPLPATTFDVVIAAAGFIPQYRWDFAVVSGKTSDVGTLVLKKGASVAGWVDVEGGAIAPGCRARLAPLVGPGSGSRTAEKVRRTMLEAPVRKDGFFQIVGVAPGEYSLEVRQPGFAVAIVNPIAVSPRSETFLRQPITLKHPLDLELALSPPLDWLGRPWKVKLFRASGDAMGKFDQTLYVGPADEQGHLKVERQTPGSFKAYVSDSLDNELASQIFQVTGPEDASRAIDLKILNLRGTVRLGKEPLAAELWFGGRHGSSSVKLDSDRDGKFQGILPHDGWWTVDIASASPKFETRAKVKVESEGADRARADIELPATRVFGKVEDDLGHPMPAATVSLSTDQSLLHEDADETGSFDIRGLPEGLAYAGASFSSAEGDWLSDRISLFLHDGEDVGPLEVRMRKEAKLSGLIESAQGPVPGAGVVVLSLRPAMTGGDSVRTDVDGTFTAHVAASTELADVVVSAPGYALKAFPVAVGPTAAQAPQTLLLEPQGGEIQILFPPPPEDLGKDATSLWLFQNGLPLPQGNLYQWASGHGKAPSVASGKGRKSLTVPELAPGEYRACLASQAILVPWEASGWTAPLAKCAMGTLTAGGALRLDLSVQ